MKEYLDLQLGRIEQLLMKGLHPIIKVVFFQKEKGGCEEGEYIQVTGMVAKIDLTARSLQVVEKRLKFNDIYRIEGEDLEYPQ